jgi:hypothetical protein
MCRDDVGQGLQSACTKLRESITPVLIEQCIGYLACGRAGGPDDLLAEHFMCAHPIVLSLLCSLFRMIIVHQYVPYD